MTTETLDKLYLEWSQFTKAKTSREIELERALESANGMCRSMHSITERKGAETNWETFSARLSESLKLQHEAMFGGRT